MADTKLVGQNYTTPDLIAKVTGRAKYAEDYRADGMLFAKLLMSPMPHARVRRIDTRAALAMPGVKAIITADDLPDLRGAERALTNEPLYQGEPILALAAVAEATAVEAIQKIEIDLEPLPFVVDPVASWLGMDEANIVLVSEYCGGGFGSKGAGAVSMVVPALLAKKAGAPVMMRISREEEHYIGRARTGMVGRARAGFAKDGRIAALDLFIVEDNGSYGPMGDYRSAALAASLIWQPLAMRWRGLAVLTNTPPRSQQRSPGPMQANAIMEPVVTKAAKKLGLDQVAIRRINSPEGKALYGPPRGNGQRGHITSAFVKQAMDRGAELFKWDERKARSGKRQGSKVRGVGVAVGPHGAGSIGYDGLMTMQPDGRLYVQSGVGNLGTHSCIDLARVAADVLAMPWDKVVVDWGNTGKGLPWSCMSVGSQTTHPMEA